jgi:AcrR family transcriptional regulator
LTPAKTASRNPLSRDRIVRTALALLDQEGLEAISMRRLAEELDVGTMTLYGYFESKAQLLEAVIDAVADESGLESAPARRRPWKEELRGLMQTLRDALVRHPSLVRLRLDRPLMTAKAFRMTEAGMRALREAGFDDREASRAFRSLFLFTFGFAAFNVHTDDDDTRRAGRQALAALPPDEYPILSSNVVEFAATLTDHEVFDYGLDRMLDGLETKAGTR